MLVEVRGEPRRIAGEDEVDQFAVLGGEPSRDVGHLRGVVPVAQQPRASLADPQMDGPFSRGTHYRIEARDQIRDQVKDLSQYNNLRVGLRLGYNLGIRKRYATLFQDENPSKPGDRKDAGSNTSF